MTIAELSIAANPTIEIEVRRLTGRLAVTLLRTLGAAHLDRIVALADHVRDRVLAGPIPENGQTARVEVAYHANRWLAEHGPVQCAAPLEATTPDDLLVALLWSTHGALPPRVSDAVILRSLLSVPVGESAQILGIPTVAVDPLVRRAIRRTQAFGLDVRRPGPQELRRGILMAFRQSSPVLRDGALETFNDNDVMVFKKKLNGAEVLVMVNTRNATINYNLPTALNNTNWKNALTNATLPLSNSVSFQRAPAIVRT